MSSWIIGAIVVACTFGGTILGYRFQSLLPKEHLTPETRDIVKVVMGILGTLSALVLGLMISSSRGSYDRQREEVFELAVKLVSLDRSLQRFGPETKQIRLDLKQVVGGAVEKILPTDSSKASEIAPDGAGDAWLRSVEALVPANDSQRFHQTRAINLGMDLMNTRWLLYHQSIGSVPLILLGLITVWFALIFFCIGMLAPNNKTVLVMMLLCALSVSGAMILGMELDRPFDGILRIPSDPILRALANMGR